MRPEGHAFAPIGRSWGSVRLTPWVPRRRRPAGPQGQVSRRSVPRMRAAPGFAPRAIARSSRRIDIAKTLFDGAQGRGEWW